MRQYRQPDKSLFVQTLEYQQAEALRQAKKRQHAARLTGAHTTMPIEDMRMVNRWLAIAKRHDASRRKGGVSWYLLLVLGFNTGLRIGDICNLRVKDVRGRERVNIEAQKTDKMSDVKLQAAAQKALNDALRGKGEDDYVLTSRQRSRRDGKARPISRQRCYSIIREIARQAGFEEHVGCHTLRKTFAWNYYKASGGDLAKLQKILDHSSQEATIHYLGLDRKALDDVIDSMETMV